MANRYFEQFLFGFNRMLTILPGRVSIGASGATSNLQGGGIYSITHLTTGTYLVTLEDNYNKFLYADFNFITTAVTGGAITAGSFVTNTLYQIVTVGTTNYNLVGLPTNIVAAPGMTFVATGAGSGTGTVKAIALSGIIDVEIVGDPNLTISPTPSTTINTSPAGSFIIQTLNTSGAAADPVSGSIMEFIILVRNSSVKGKGE